MGVSKKRLSDFGGGRKVSKGESPIDCMEREVEEETGGLLTPQIRESIEREDGLILFGAYSRKNDTLTDLLMLVPIPYYDYPSCFVSTEEIKSIRWMPREKVIESRRDRLHGPIVRYIQSFRQHDSSIA